MKPVKTLDGLECHNKMLRAKIKRLERELIELINKPVSYEDRVRLLREMINVDLFRISVEMSQDPAMKKKHVTAVSNFIIQAICLADGN